MPTQPPRDYHKWRWRALYIWIVIFTIAVGYGIRKNREAINEVKANSAKVSALQRTNCGLEKFLLTARRARWASYQRDKDESDLQAVKGYETLLHPFVDESASGSCTVPKRLLIPARPIGITSG